MRIQPPRRTVLAGLLVPLVLAASACSGGDSSTTADPAPEPTTTLPTTEPSTSDSATAEPTDDASGEEVADPTAFFQQMTQAMRREKTVKVAMDFGVGTATGEMSFEGRIPDMTLRMDLSEGPSGMEMRMVDGVPYLTWPGALTPRGKFVRLDRVNGLAGLADTMRGSSPMDSVQQFAKALRSMTVLGEENVDGEPTTHYLMEIDTAKATDLLNQPDLAGDARQDLPKTLFADMWVTDDDLVRRVVMSMGPVTIQLDYTDWGAPVNIQAPAPGDIVAAPNGS